jgi:hypothetical protein
MPEEKWVTVRLTLPENLHCELRKLGSDMRLRPRVVLVEAVTMLLKFHGRGNHLPGPLPQCPPELYR